MARKHYPAAAVRWNHAFIDILSTSANGTDRFDYTKFHEIEPMDADDPAG
jgi:hypothetical protein